MAQIDVLRPVSIFNSGSWTASTGTLNSATSDDNDATYASSGGANTSFMWLTVTSHTPPAGHQRHRIRGRMRAYGNGGTAVASIGCGRSGPFANQGQSKNLTAVVAAYEQDWLTNWSGTYVPASGTVTDFGCLVYRHSGADVRATELYVDIDCRAAPDFNISAGNLTSNDPTIQVTDVDLDGLPANQWSITVRDAGLTTVFSTSGSGAVPSETHLGALVDGTYEAEVTVSSVIRGIDAYPTTKTYAFAVDTPVPPPPPPANITVTHTAFGIEISWEDPGGQPYDSTPVVEIERTDCRGTRTIAVIPDAYSGSYLDTTAPLDDDTCGASPCEVTYRVRYVGQVSEQILPPENVPEGFIIGWPGDAGDIPAGWDRVTALDGRFVMGATSDADQGDTGGSATHSHAAFTHNHAVPAHSHAVGGSTATWSGATRQQAAPGETAEQRAGNVHTHTLASATSSVATATASASPAVSTGDNLPPFVEVIFYASDGTPTEIPAGAVAFSVEDVAAWEDFAAAASRYLRGAPTAGNGGATGGSATHTHTIASHTHAGDAHTHTMANTGTT